MGLLFYGVIILLAVLSSLPKEVFEPTARPGRGRCDCVYEGIIVLAQSTQQVARTLLFAAPAGAIAAVFKHHPLL